MAAKTSKSSASWLREHFSDLYVKKAQQEGYRSRAIYKLMEIDQRDRLFKPGMVVVDLGAAPGSWAQWVQKRIHPNGQLIAVDLLPIPDIEGVQCIQGDFTEDATLATLLAHLEGKSVDWVLSDMAPNMSGNKSVDMPRAMYLGELTLDFAKEHLKEGGGLLMKLFQGEGSEDLLRAIKATFHSMTIRKPKASRDRSREIYVLAKGLK